MITRHRNQAIVGVVIWFAVLLAYGLAAVYASAHDGPGPPFSAGLFSTLFWGGIILGMLSFLWGGYHLAKGKGYSTALAAIGLFPCLQPALLTMLFVLPDKNAKPTNYCQPVRVHQPIESAIGRVVRYRRNALVQNCFGLLFVLIGIWMTLFPVGIFEDFENESLCGFLVFVGGYVGVMSGCRWWLKAKGWSEAIIFIGLTPLTICLIPFVRNIFIIEPVLLPLSMLLMTLMLLVVIFALPNKSGMTARSRNKKLRWPYQTATAPSPEKPRRTLASARILPATEDDLPALAELAGNIWRQHYPGIISPEQIDYMLGKMYALEALREQIRTQGIQFVRLLVGERFVGFASYGPATAPGVMKLHKCYLLPEMHGRGYGTLLLQHCDREARHRGAHRLILAVNKHNAKAVAAYQRNGFAVVESVITDFGSGFVMDDFIMAKDLPPV